MWEDSWKQKEREKKKKTNTVGTKALNTEGVLSNDFETNNTICTNTELQTPT